MFFIAAIPCYSTLIWRERWHRYNTGSVSIGENLGSSDFWTEFVRKIWLRMWWTSAQTPARGMWPTTKRWQTLCLYNRRTRFPKSPSCHPPVRPSNQGGAGPTVWTKLARCRWGRIWLRHQLWGRVTLHRNSIVRTIAQVSWWIWLHLYSVL